MFDERDRARGVQHGAGLLAQLTDLGEDAVQVDRRRRLTRHEQVVGAGAREVLEVALGLHHHQVDVEWLRRRLAHGCDDQRAEADVGNEAAVHDVDMDPVGAGRVDRANLVGKAAQVSGKNRRGNDGRLHAALVA